MSKARLTLAKNVSALTMKQDAFIKAVETMKIFKDETLLEFDLELENKRKEIEDLEKQRKNKEIDDKISCDQSVMKYKYDAAIKILKEVGEIAIVSEEIDNLRQELKNSKEQQEDRIQKVIAEQKASQAKAVSVISTNSELKHKAEHAELTASVKQRDNQILLLTTTIDNLRNELSEQRKLTKDVAMAGKSGAISQSFGKQ